jgi:multidrug efflux system membrane fusion protein
MATKEKDAAQLATAQADLVRYGRLVGPGFQTRQSYEQQQGLVAQLQASIKGDEAQIDTARVNLGYTDIRSPGVTGHAKWHQPASTRLKCLRPGEETVTD